MQSTATTKPRLIPKFEIQETKDYSIFKFMEGNRPLDKTHINQLAKHMTETGNLTDMFPVTVNEHMYVIDGQHRIKALEQLKWPVYYRVVTGSTLATVRSINAAQKNWGWLDYAHAWALVHKPEYIWLLGLHREYPQYGYRTLMAFTQPKIGKNVGTSMIFRNGEYKCTDHSAAETRLRLYTELTDVAEFNTREFSLAMAEIMRVKDYDHKRMVEQLDLRKHNLIRFATVADNLRQIEDVYNYNKSEVNRVRLF